VGTSFAICRIVLSASRHLVLVHEHGLTAFGSTGNRSHVRSADERLGMGESLVPYMYQLPVHEEVTSGSLDAQAALQQFAASVVHSTIAD